MQIRTAICGLYEHISPQTRQTRTSGVSFAVAHTLPLSHRFSLSFAIFVLFLSLFTHSLTYTTTHPFSPISVSLSHTHNLSVSLFVCVCVCVCVRERQRWERMGTHTTSLSHTHNLSVSLFVCVCVCVWEREVVCVCVRERERERKVLLWVTHHLSVIRSHSSWVYVWNMILHTG